MAKAERVKVIADRRTQGAQAGAVAHPLKRDLDKWLALGWHRAEPPAKAAEKEPEGQ